MPAGGGQPLYPPPAPVHRDAHRFESGDHRICLASRHLAVAGRAELCDQSRDPLSQHHPLRPPPQRLLTSMATSEILYPESLPGDNLVDVAAKSYDELKNMTETGP